jgi:hypothetical protein
MTASPGEGLLTCDCDEQQRLVLEDLRPGMPITLQVLGDFEDILVETVLAPLERSERRRVVLPLPAPGGVLSGRTLAQDGTPLPRVRLSLRRADGRHAVRLSEGTGRFRFSLPETGTFDLVGEKRGWAGEPRTVSVGTEAGSDVELRLQPGRNLVVDVVDPYGVRVPSARLVALTPAGYLPKFAREDRAGRLHLADLPWLPCVLEVRIGGRRLTKAIDALVLEERFELPGFGRVEFDWDTGSAPASDASVGTHFQVVLRPKQADLDLLVEWNLDARPGAFAFVWPGEYTLGLESCAEQDSGDPSRWQRVRSPVPVQVGAGRTTSVLLGR